MVIWNFPNNNGGQIRGVSDAGIETFNGREIPSLAREICQNSLDAVDNQEEPVRVEFYRHQIMKQDIPGYTRYEEVINRSYDYWTQNNVLKAREFLRNALISMDSDTTYVLRVSDFNTVGLADPFSDSLQGWNSLTKLDGGATKSGDSQGSYGIGKNAPFSNSYLRMVFYRTLNTAGEQAAQGIARLISYPENPAKPLQTMASGIGYYGDPEGNMPVRKLPQLEDLNVRRKKGTDVFVYAFRSRQDTWVDELIPAVLDNFTVSLFNRQLSVTVQDTNDINADSLLQYYEKYKNTVTEAYWEYHAISTQVDNKNTFEFERDFHGMGNLILRVFVDPKRKLNRKILVVRKTGMKLFRMGNISRSISFTGVLMLQGKQLNEYFGKMENPSHDKWEPARHDQYKGLDKVLAQSRAKELKEWVRDRVFELAEIADDGEINVDGLSNVLLEDQDSIDNSTDTENKAESLNNLLGKLEIIERKQSNAAVGMLYRNNGPKEKKEKTPGKITNKGNETAVRTLKGKRKRKKKDLHRGVADPNGKDFVNQTTKVNGGPSEDAELKNVRIIKQGSNSYTVSFNVPESIYKGHIEITTIGENGKSNTLNIDNAFVVSGVETVGVSNNIIEFTNMSGSEKVKIGFRLSTSSNYAMEVNVYEHN